jgi:ATP-dependent exoDNAse (exonuclease V) alpha subunit
MQRGNQRGYDDPMLVSPQLRIWTEDQHSELSRSQRQAVDEIFLSREKIVGLDGVAGAGKTTTLSFVREGAEAQGYRAEGFAPTSRAAHRLAEAGMETSTLQRHLAKGVQPRANLRKSATGMRTLLPILRSRLAAHWNLDTRMTEADLAHYAA